MGASTGLLELLSRYAVWKPQTAGYLDTPGDKNSPAVKDAAALASSTAIVFGVQRLVPTYDNSWYKALTKPKWTPPNWVFPVMWIPLKLMQSVAAWLVWRTAAQPMDLALPFAVFGAELFLGNWWNVGFFGQHKMQQSLPWMGALWLSNALTAAAFYRVHPAAGLLMLPTQGWLSVAAKLNYDIVALNTGSKNK